MDRIYSSLFNSKWYLLPLREQRCMQLVLAKAQKPVILMAGTIPLNMDSFVQVSCGQQLDQYVLIILFAGDEKRLQCRNVSTRIDTLNLVSDIGTNFNFGFVFAIEPTILLI